MRPTINDSLQSQTLHTSAQQGFTLIEVMVALAILATVAVVASQASGTYLRSVDNLKTRTLAHFVAQNTAADLQINPQWPQSTQVNKVVAQGRTWQVSIVPMSIGEVLGEGNGNYSMSNLEDSIRPLSIEVAPINEQTNEVQHSIADVTLLVPNPSNTQGKVLNQTSSPATGLTNTAIPPANANANLNVNDGNQDAN